MIKQIAVFSILSLIVAASYPKEGMSCISDEDCWQPFEFCSTVEAVCEHKHVFPINGNEWGGYVVIVLAIMFANAGGLSGGGIVVPVLLSFFGFGMKQAIA